MNGVLEAKATSNQSTQAPICLAVPEAQGGGYPVFQGFQRIQSPLIFYYLHFHYQIFQHSPIFEGPQKFPDFPHFLPFLYHSLPHVHKVPCAKIKTNLNIDFLTEGMFFFKLNCLTIIFTQIPVQNAQES